MLVFCSPFDGVRMDTVPYETRKMLLAIAYAFGDGEFLSFVEFTKLVVAVLEDVLNDVRELQQFPESAKAKIVYELWQDYAAGRRRPLNPG